MIVTHNENRRKGWIRKPPFIVGAHAEKLGAKGQDAKKTVLGSLEIFSGVAIRNQSSLK